MSGERWSKRCGLCGWFLNRWGRCANEVRVFDSWTGWEHR